MNFEVSENPLGSEFARPVLGAGEEQREASSGSCSSALLQEPEILNFKALWIPPEPKSEIQNA